MLDLVSATNYYTNLQILQEQSFTLALVYGVRTSLENKLFTEDRFALFSIFDAACNYYPLKVWVHKSHTAGKLPSLLHTFSLMRMNLRWKTISVCNDVRMEWSFSLSREGHLKKASCPTPLSSSIYFYSVCKDNKSNNHCIMMQRDLITICRNVHIKCGPNTLFCVCI